MTIATSGQFYEESIPAPPFSIEPFIRSSQLTQYQGAAFVLTNANIGTLGDADMLLMKLDAGGNTVHSLTIGDMSGQGYHDVGMEAVQLGGNLFVCGYTRSIDTAAAHTFTAFLIKCDTALNFEWQKNYILPGPSELYANAITTTDNGQFLIAGQLYDGSDFHTMLMKVAADGSLLWMKQYDIPHGERIHCVRELPGGDILLSGNAVFGFELVLPVVFKVNATGDFIWGKYYNYPPMSVVENSNFLFMQVLSVDDILLCGHTDVVGAGSEDFYVVDIDSSGALNWARTYGASQFEFPSAARFDATANELVILGNSTSFTASFTPKALAMRIAPGGLLIDAKLYGDTSTSMITALDHCQRISPGTRLLSGWRGFPSDDLYLAGLDNDLDNSCNAHPVAPAWPAQTTTSGPFTAAVTAPSPIVNDVAFLTSTFSGDSVLCSTPTGMAPAVCARTGMIRILPNPCTGPFQVLCDMALSTHDRIEVWNAQGQRVSTVHGHNSSEVTIGTALASGMYEVRLVRDGLQAGAARVVVR